MCILISMQLLSETFLILRRIQQDKCTSIFEESTCYSCHILMKLVLRQIFKKISIKFYENPSSGSRDVPCGQTDRQTSHTCMKILYAARTEVTS